jgi:hypothetical protein
MVSEERKAEIIEYMKVLMTENGKWDEEGFLGFIGLQDDGWEQADNMVQVSQDNPEVREAFAKLIRTTREERGWAVPNGK